MRKSLSPIPPGEILLEEFLRPLGISQNKLARDLDVPVGRINDIIKGKRGISADTALRLATYFETTAELWLNLQTRYDLKVASATLGPKVRRAVRPHRRAA
jgi:addiction module HigA family antidote